MVSFFSTTFLLPEVELNPLLWVFKKGELRELFALNSYTFEDNPYVLDESVNFLSFA